MITDPLGQNVWFPDPAEADEDGLVAFCDDLSVPRLLAAYRQGIFPWTVKPVTWWSPDPRGIFELDRLHIPRRLAQKLRKNPYEVTFDRAFRDVMAGCAAAAPGREETWIAPAFITAYTRLHKQGHAHSVECWQDGQLVGGVYGVQVGGLFAGESMFHRADDASKIAICHLVERLRAGGFVLFDIQQVTPATRQLGAVEIPRSDYLRRLKDAVSIKATFQPTAESSTRPSQTA